jgi:pyridoxal phosphate enzyme (YggS family)
MSVKDNILEFKKLLKNKNCQLVAVSKTKPVEMIQEAYDAGQLDFGENKVQELREKPELLPGDIRWHMIGHLQTNKVKYIAPFIHLIHAVDSLRLLEEIQKQAVKNQRIIHCLLQIHIAKEEHKFGLSEEELMVLLSGEVFKTLTNIKVTGLMGMATYTENEAQIRSEFRYLKSIFDRVADSDRLPNLELKVLSMGMSDDYRIAMEEGSTMIRVGSKIFGPRIHLND